MTAATTPEPQRPDGPLPAGTPAPGFTLPSGPDSQLRLSDLRGKPVILAFYPADWSPVCGDQPVGCMRGLGGRRSQVLE